MNKRIRSWVKRFALVVRNNYRWLIVGLSTKLLDFSAFNVVYVINKNILLANALSAMLSVSYNYMMHHHEHYQK
jgi:putative flippase GtrA